MLLVLSMTGMRMLSEVSKTIDQFLLILLGFQSSSLPCTFKTSRWIYNENQVVFAFHRSFSFSLFGRKSVVGIGTLLFWRPLCDEDLLLTSYN